jgi:MazG family protein
MEKLLEIMKSLRNPETGCPWDVEQTFETIAPYTIEEAYEVEEAVKSGDMSALRDELGDLLLQVVFQSRIAEEEGHFNFSDVVDGICDKMIRRHPHVFSNDSINSADEQTIAWEAHKAVERANKANTMGNVPSVLEGVSLGLPALLRAVKLQKRAARVGFDWPDASFVLEKIREESDELAIEMAKQAGTENPSPEMYEEFGDLLFVYANLARHLNIDPEAALRGTNRKFERRFHYIEEQLTLQNKQISDSNLDEMDKLWDEAKRAEKLKGNR